MCLCILSVRGSTCHMLYDLYIQSTHRVRIYPFVFLPVHHPSTRALETRSIKSYVGTLRAAAHASTASSTTRQPPTGVGEKNTPFRRASAFRQSNINCYPAPDLVFFQLNFPRVLFSGGVFLFADAGSTRCHLRMLLEQRLALGILICMYMCIHMYNYMCVYIYIYTYIYIYI